MTTKAARTRRRSRSDELRTLLQHRLYQLTQDVQGRIRDSRVDHGNDRPANDQGSSELDIQDDIEFALIQMKAETIKRIDTALRRLDEGTYGDCFECGNEIAGARLRALAFALRCKDSEETHEVAEQREAQRRHLSAPFFD